MVDLASAPQVQSQELPGRAYPHLPEEASPASTGAPLAHGVAEVGDVLQQHYEAAQRFAQQSQHADGVNQLQAAALDLSHNPKTGFLTTQGKDAFGLDQNPNYLPKFDSQAQDLIDSTQDPKVKQALIDSAGHIRNQLAEQMDAHEIEQHKQFGISTAKASIGLAQTNAQSNYNHSEIIASAKDTIDVSIDRLAQQMGWGPEEVQEAKESEHSKLNAGVIQNMLADNKPEMANAYLDSVRGELKPAEAKEFETQIRSGQVKTTADNILGAYRLGTDVGQKQMQALANSGLGAEDQAQVVRQVESGRQEFAAQQRQNPQVMRQLTALDDKISSGSVAPGDMGTVDRLWKSGAVTDDQRLMMRGEINRGLKKGQDDQLLGEYATEHYDSREPLDPKSPMDKKAAQLLLDRASVPPGTSAWQNAAVEVTHRVGVVPEGVVSWSRANLYSGEPTSAAQAAQTLSELQRLSPQAYEAATDPEMRALAHQVNEAVSAGADPVGAVTMARENAQKSPAEQKLLTEKWDQQKPQGTEWSQIDTKAIKDGLSDDPHYTGSPRFVFGIGKPGVPEPPLAMQADYSALTRQYFGHTGGNLKQAQQLALNDLKSTWGVSEVNGKRELMKFAPERMVPGLTADAVKADMESAAGPGARLLEAPGVTESTGGKRWMLGKPDQFGLPDVVRREDGTPRYYDLPTPAAGTREAQEKQDSEDRAKLAVEQAQRQAESARYAVQMARPF